MAKKRSGPDLATRFAKIGEVIETAAEWELIKIGTKVRDEASKNASSNPKSSGDLGNSYGVRLRHRGTTPVAVIGTTSPYGTIYEFAKDVSGHAYGKNTKHEPGRALYAAMDDNMKDIEKMIADAIGKGLGAIEGA